VTLSDVDGDGVPDLAITAPLDSSNGSESGAVFIVSGSDGRLLHRFHGGRPGERFGSFLSSCPDLDQDGAPDLLAGGDGPVRALSVRTGAVLRELSRSPAALALDLDCDGVPDWIVGAPEFAEPVFGIVRGAVVAVSGRDGRQLLRILGEMPLAGTIGSVEPSMFGSTLLGIGDLDGDGVPDLAVGATG
jgi:hypothetical protein